MAGKLAEAESLQRAEVALETRLKGSAVAEGMAREALALTFYDERRADSAESEERAALEAFRAGAAPEHWRIWSAQRNLAIIVAARGRVADGLALLDSAVAVARTGPGLGTEAGYLTAQRIPFLLRLGRVGDASQAVATSERILGTSAVVSSAHRADVDRYAGMVALASGDAKLAADRFRAAVTLAEPPDKPETAPGINSCLLGVSLARLGRFAEAQPLLDKPCTAYASHGIPDPLIEGWISDDPATYESEGPFGEFTGYVSDIPTPRPTMRITCITHRRDPIFQGCLEGTLPGSYSENSVMSSVQRAAIAWNILSGAGIPGIRDVFVPPITNGVNIVVQIRKAYQGQPKQIAAALWGNSAAQYRYKHVTVVEEDIDPSSYEQVDWAFAHRVNAGEDGIVIFPGIFGSPIDPSTPMADRDVSRLGTGLWNRVLIDATRSWKFERRPEWGNERFPPTVRPAAEDETRVRARWVEYGLGDL